VIVIVKGGLKSADAEELLGAAVAGPGAVSRITERSKRRAHGPIT